MRQITKTVYLFAELTDENAKERARQWLREFVAQDFDAEFVVDEFATLLHACGFDVHARRGHRGTVKAINWNTNPVEAGFEASWSAARLIGKTCVEACAAITADRPNDTETHYAMIALHTFATAHPHATADVGSGRDGCTPTVEFSLNGDDDGETEEGTAADDFREHVTDLAHQFAKQVNAEYEYQLSDESIDESMEANEYEFDEKGNRT